LASARTVTRPCAVALTAVGLLTIPLFLVSGASAAAPSLTITPIYSGTTGSSGWYKSAVYVNWDIEPKDVPYTSSGCDGTKIDTETIGTTRTCTATNADGAVFQTTTKLIMIDWTPPLVTAAPTRSPDSNGWYNHALTVGFSGTDATSKVASCSSGTYAGPDNASAAVSGTCTDNAGNIGSVAFPLKYDATPPTISKVTAKTGNRKLDLAWAATGAQSFQVMRTSSARGVKSGLVYSGTGVGFRDTRLKVGAHYQYTVIATDQASNSASKSVLVTATGALLAPAPGASVSRPPVLRWTAVKGAAYYNVQLVRGKKILSAWPATNYFRLPRSWAFHGHRYRLHRGVYRWYVWPGFGTFSASKYGSVLGGSSFVYSP
jgi:hypothetical protein